MFTKRKVRKLLTLRDKKFPILTLRCLRSSVIRLTFIKEGSFQFRVYSDLDGSGYIVRLNSIRMIKSTDVDKDIVLSLDDQYYCIMESVNSKVK